MCVFGCHALRCTPRFISLEESKWVQQAGSTCWTVLPCHHNELNVYIHMNAGFCTKKSSSWMCVSLLVDVTRIGTWREA